MSKPGNRKTWTRPELETQIENVLLATVLETGAPSISSYDGVHSLSTKLVEQAPWRPYLSAFDVFDILHEGIATHLGDTRKESNGNLTEILTAREFNVLKKSIADYLLSIPREYDVYFELPMMPKWGKGEVQLSKHTALVERASYAPDPLQLHAKAGMLGGLAPEPATAIYLRVSGSGFGARRLDTTAVTSALSTLKHFLQILEHSPAFHRQWGIISALITSVHCYVVDRKAPDKPKEVTLPESFGKYLATAGLNEFKLMVRDGQGLLSSERKASIREEKARSLKGSMPALEILDCGDKEPDAVRILTAMEWAVDSRVSDNQTLSFLQACIGLEALLGDDNQDEPLTTRLADRCAYLLGKGERQRKDIRKRFKDIYDVRSKLIHGRKARLDLHEEERRFEAQIMLGNVIWREVANLQAVLAVEAAKAR